MTMKSTPENLKECSTESWCEDMQSGGVAALGTAQILIGLFNIGLGPGRPSLHPGDFSSIGAAYWLGAVFVVVGVLSLVAALIPQVYLLCSAVLLNIVGGIFAITGAVLYVLDLRDTSLTALCGGDDEDNCTHVALFVQRLWSWMDVGLLLLCGLQLGLSTIITVWALRTSTVPHMKICQSSTERLV